MNGQFRVKAITGVSTVYLRDNGLESVCPRWGMLLAWCSGANYIKYIESVTMGVPQFFSDPTQKKRLQEVFHTDCTNLWTPGCLLPGECLLCLQWRVHYLYDIYDYVGWNLSASVYKVIFFPKPFLNVDGTWTHVFCSKSRYYLQNNPRELQIKKFTCIFANFGQIFML